MSSRASRAWWSSQRNRASAAAAAAAEARLRCELHQAREALEDMSARAVKATWLLDERESEQCRAAKELESTRHALRVREAEVRELQLLGKYFAGRAKPPDKPELSLAALAEDLRAKCGKLQEELEALRAERDLLRAERGRSERLAGAHGGGAFGALGRAVSGADWAAAASRLLEQPGRSPVAC
mmetsp:Transcript_152796/g.490116  ORF Transcript_152796/g.490116 Transcript_152796/m.490116 type:complete len:184 (+) Transcript_152796:518-1069(+)